MMTLPKPSDNSIWRRMTLSVTLTLAIAGNSYLGSAPQLKQISTVINLANRCLKQDAFSSESQHLVETVLKKVGVQECSQGNLTRFYPIPDQRLESHPQKLLTYLPFTEPESDLSGLRN